MTIRHLSACVLLFLLSVASSALAANARLSRTGATPEHECPEPGDGDVELSVQTGVGPARQCYLKTPVLKSEDELAEAEAQPRPKARKQREPAPVPELKQMPAPAPVPPAPAVVHVDEINFDAEVAQYSGLMLIDFFTPMCSPCRRTSPIVDEWGEKFRGRLKVVKIDGSQAPKLVDRFGVSTVPCLILLKDGKELNRQKGEPPRDLLDGWVRQANS